MSPPRIARLARLACLLLVAGPIAGLGPQARADDWPQFRGPDRNAISKETGLLRQWPETGPEKLWATEACEGYSGAAIRAGKVYFNDYDKKARAWLVRCLDLETGEEQWRFTEKRRIRPNHGITRSVPAVDAERVYSLDPKCTFHCLDAATGKELWRKNLVQEFHATIPAWYNGQCPLLEDDKVILAPGGDALMVAFDKQTGDAIWKTPNPKSLTMTHASVMPAALGGVEQYLTCTLESVIGVAAGDGKLLWSFPWKFNIAVPVSPAVVGDGLVFVTSCYEADSAMFRVTREADAFVTKQVFSLTSADWNSEVHTPIVHDNHLFAVGKKKRGLFTCLDLEGNQVWTSRGQASFGLGGYIMADGMFLILDGDTGMLRLLEASTTAYRELAHAQVLDGHDVWAPPALADGKLVIRDMTKMICLRVAPPPAAGSGHP